MSNEMKLFDIDEIKSAIAVLFADVRFGAGECVEVRIFDKGKNLTATGWFDDPKLLARAVARAARDGVGNGYRHLHESVYWTCNPVKEALLSRKPRNQMAVYASATSDGDITRRLWLPVDIDPWRSAGVSATTDERKLAREVLIATEDALNMLGVTKDMYVVATSGNGYHIMLRVDLPNDADSKTLVQDCLKGLQALAGTPTVHIDPTVHNAARITKAYGTIARKGMNDVERPWRMAKLLQVPEAVQVVSREVLERLAAHAPVADTKRAVNAPAELQRATITAPGKSAKAQGPWTDELLAAYLAEGTDWEYVRREARSQKEVCRYVGRCVNDPNHTDAAVILHRDGWWSYGCFHASCATFRHREFRQHWAERKGGWSLPQRDVKGFEVEEVTGFDELTAEGDAVNSEPMPLYNLTDAGNAERLAWRYRDDYLYCPQRDWYKWDGTRWRPDAEEEITRAAIETVRAIRGECGRQFQRDDQGFEEYAKFQKWFRKFCAAAEGGARLASMRTLAQAYMPVGLDRFDADPMLYNVANGTLDLRTGVLRPHDRAAYCTNVSPVSYREDAECPLWLEFLADVTGCDQQLIDYLQRAVGYSLTGLTTEHCMFILWGSGRNGKSTFLEVIRHLLGDYGQAANMSTFTLQSHEGIPNDLAALSAARFVSASESDEGKRLAEAKIKQITGGDTVTARYLHKEFFSFKPQFKIWLATNHKPVIYGTDDGIWRRLRLLPFTVYIPDSKKDETLTAKLIAEAPGILNWALAGLEDYRKHGMREPEIVKATTDAYRESQDWLSRFLEETTEVSETGSVGARELYLHYKSWCQETGEYELKEIKFADALKMKGRKSRRIVYNGKQMRRYTGLRLRASSGFEVETVRDSPDELLY